MAERFRIGEIAILVLAQGEVPHPMNFRTAERYGLVAAAPREIVFYFEQQKGDGE